MCVICGLKCFQNQRSDFSPFAILYSFCIVYVFFYQTAYIDMHELWHKWNSQNLNSTKEFTICAKCSDRGKPLLKYQRGILNGKINAK